MTSINQCGSTTSNKPIQVNPYPIISGGNDQTVCDGIPVILAGSGATSFSWDNGVINGNPFQPPVGTTLYTVIGTTNGCSDTDYVSITVNALPSVSAGANQTICAGQPVTLTGTGTATSYTWNNGVSNGVAFTPTSTNTYIVTGIGGNGCAKTDTTIVTVNALPTPAITGSLSYCAGSNTILDAGNYSSYLWSTTGTMQTIHATIANNPITVTVTDMNGCIGTSASVNLVENPLPTPTITGSLSYCTGSNTILDAGNYSSYLWSTTDTTQTTHATIANNPVTVTVTDINGCTGTSASVNLIKNPLPTPTITGSLSYCAGLYTTLSTEVYNNYQWSDGSVNQSTNVTIVNNPVTVTVTDANGCSQTQTVTISENPSPTVIVTANPTDIISGSNTQLNASGGVTYQWTPITGLSCNTCVNPTASPTTTTTYCARVTDGNGCVDSACVVITVEMPCGEIFVPNAFSPNSDGANDQECVKGNCIQTFHFVIYDRWGEKVFETNDINQCWDGTYKGKQMNTAVYVYFMEATITTGEKVTKKGNISLVR
jgi:gliding motility-associated-like protein